MEKLEILISELEAEKATLLRLIDEDVKAQSTTSRLRNRKSTKKSLKLGGLFEGICQDDPAISKIDFHADVFGKLEGNELTFNKIYPKAMFRDNFGKLTMIDQPHPDVLYHAQISNKRRSSEHGKSKGLFESWAIT